MFRINVKLRIMLGIGLVIVSGVWTRSQGQQLRDAFRKVEQAVVIVRTAQKELAPFPQEGMVSLNGLGSGVLVSSDGKVLTAAHLVQVADAITVESANGEVIPARVAGTTVSADVALLQLERAPRDLAPATLANSDQAAVGDEVFVVGSPYGLSHTLTAGHISGRYAINRGPENTLVSTAPAAAYRLSDVSVGRQVPTASCKRCASLSPSFESRSSASLGIAA
jgi:S1-C subfamily serine protease